MADAISTPIPANPIQPELNVFYDVMQSYFVETISISRAAKSVMMSEVDDKQQIEVLSGLMDVMLKISSAALEDLHGEAMGGWPRLGVLAKV